MLHEETLPVKQLSSDRGAVHRYNFPTRLEACHEVIHLVQACPHHAIVIAVDSLGKGRGPLQWRHASRLSMHTLWWNEGGIPGEDSNC